MATVAPAVFQTRCSSCDAVQAVTPEALQTNTGLLRCPSCDSIFNAAWSLVDQIPNPARPADREPSRREPALTKHGPASHNQGAAKVAQSHAAVFRAGTLAAEHPELSQIPPASGPYGRKEPRLVIGDNDAQTQTGAASAAERQVQAAGAMPRGLPLAGAVLAVIVLLAQIRFPLLEAVASVEATRPALTLMCRYTGCRLPAPTEGPAVSVTRSSMGLHRHRPAALVLRIHLLNHSATLQDYPAIEVTLNNAAGEVVGRRTYLPRELGVTDETRMLESGRDAVVTLILAKSDQTVSGITARAVQF
ncbi:MAG: hypothetical protein CL389_04890 [Acidiferrobacteraceae bacterium]|nr:hypothetical protein [Acidiferrobacteraceae bacterium]